jgi:rhamnosyltransferase
MHPIATPSISVVIPVKNEALKIDACIQGILSQTIPVKEIIIIDSGSTDGTVEILKKYPIVQVIEIPGASFNHGLTRNLGVERATGEYVLLTVGDARSYNNNWIEELMKGFESEEVVAVCGQQVVPHEKDKNPVNWFRPQSPPTFNKYQFTKEAFEGLSPAEKRNVCGWDDVTAMYKRTTLLAIPFQKTSYSEDAIWAKQALLSGYAIAYNTAARVFHYHLEDETFTFKRSFTSMYFRYKQFGFIPVKPRTTLYNKIRILKILTQSLGGDLKAIVGWHKYNVANSKAMLKAYDIFMDCLGKGETFLDTRHAELCGKPPIPLKSN